MQTTVAVNDRQLGEEGYTLVELVVVLAIISLLAAVATTALRDRPHSLDPDRLGLRLRDAITAARGTARSTTRATVVELSTFAVEDIAIEPAIGNSTDRILVFADGSSTGGTISVAGKPFVHVDWFTGRVKDAR